MDTQSRIIEAAESLIQERGFNGFSFQDIADRIGIKKGSLYYHFPAKADLGRAVVERYRQRMRAASDLIAAGEVPDYWDALELYLKPMLAFGRTPDDACVCIVLAGEVLGLPEEMHAEIAAFFDEHQVWLTSLLEGGRQAGAFRFAAAADQMATLIFSAMEGGLLIKRIKGDTAYFDRVVAGLLALLGLGASGR
ncbi:TetR/AcrR family transcriptional regulator [Devosia sp.]|uniref:TetR/AcrR family transcriptional regulator n=1 Tax=Devosia sp. TaxID=1871048 RepID=UPI003264A1BD